MTNGPGNDPISLLRGLEERAKRSPHRLPDDAGSDEVWRGIGFRVGERNLVIAMNEIDEVLHVPRSTRVPGAKDWVVGVANLRGALLPLIDLHGFLRGWLTETTRDARVLVIKRGEILVGLLVHEVYGLKHFLSKQRKQDAESGCEWLRPYRSGVFETEDREWTVLDLSALLEAPAFMQVAA